MPEAGHGISEPGAESGSESGASGDEPWEVTSDQEAEAQIRPQHWRRSRPEVGERVRDPLEDEYVGLGIKPANEPQAAAEAAGPAAAAGPQDEVLPIENDGEQRPGVGAPVLGDVRALPVLGEVREFMGAIQAQEKIVELSRAAEHFIVALFFTFDREEMATAWKDAVRRGVEVEIGVDRDWTFSGQCRDQYRLIRSLVSAGVKVRLLRGVDRKAAYAAVGRSFGGVGNQHAKLVHTDKGAVVGSTNFTTSSRGK